MKLSNRKQLLSEADVELKRIKSLNESKLNEAPSGRKAENDPRNIRQLKAVIPEIQKTTSDLESQIQNTLAKNANQIMKKLEPLLKDFEWIGPNGKRNVVNKVLEVSIFPEQMIERDIFEKKMELDVRVRLAVRIKDFGSETGYIGNFSLQNLLSYVKG